MAVRLRYKVEISISSSTSEERDLGDLKYEVVADSQGEGGAWKTLLPNSTTNQLIQLPNVATARFLAIRTTSRDPTLLPVTVTLRRNTVAGEAIDIVPLSGAKEGHLLISTTGLTALYGTNASSDTDMDLTILCAGD